jgi:hypothetical protein
MTITRPDRLAPGAPHIDPFERSPSVALLLVVAVALAASVALIVPGRVDGHPFDAASEGIARAARCDATFEAADANDGPDRWADCIDRQLHRLPVDPVALAGLHFHAWRIAGPGVAAGTGRSRARRDVHRRLLSDALNRNLLSLHRLCAAAVADCRPIALRLARQG